jgi:hypothetical protein
VEDYNDFSNILLKSAKDALNGTIGESAAAAIDFCCDPSLLKEDPGKYSEDLGSYSGWVQASLKMS